MNPMTVTWPKIQDGAAAIFKIGFMAIIHRSIVRFQRNFVWGSRTACRYGLQKLQIFKIQDGGRPPFWKSINRHISVKNHPILIKFGTLQQIMNSMTVTWPKIEIFKIQDGGGRHLKNRFFWPLLINWLSDFSEILYEEAERHADKGYGTKMEMCKIQQGGRPPFWKSLNRHLSEKLSDFVETWYTASDIAPDDSLVTKNWNFYNSRWRRPPSWKSLFRP